MFRNREISLFITAVILVLVSALLQNTEFLSFYGIKINLVLALLLTFGFFIHNFWHYLTLSLEGILLLKISPGLDKQTLALFILVIAAFYLKKYLFWQPIINNVFLIIVATALFYLLIDFDFLIYNTATIILEAVYNVICGLVLYLILKRIYGEINVR